MYVRHLEFAARLLLEQIYYSRDLHNVSDHTSLRHPNVRIFYPSTVKAIKFMFANSDKRFLCLRFVVCPFTKLSNNTNTLSGRMLLSLSSLIDNTLYVSFSCHFTKPSNNKNAFAGRLLPLLSSPINNTMHISFLRYFTKPSNNRNTSASQLLVFCISTNI